MISKSGENGYSSKNIKMKKISSLNGFKKLCTKKKTKKLKLYYVLNFGSMIHFNQ